MDLAALPLRVLPSMEMFQQQFQVIGVRGIDGLSTQGIETDSTSPVPARQNIHITNNKFVYAGSSVVLYNTVGFEVSNVIMERASINYVTACAAVCRQAGFPKAIGFDMGGTSTDVSRIDGSPEFIYEKQVAGVRIKAPMLWVETVAAGGGSILAFDGRRCTVGPESAGAQPSGVLRSGRGLATVTDANLVLGRIQPRYFPACFGPQAPINRWTRRRLTRDCRNWRRR